MSEWIDRDGEEWSKEEMVRWVMRNGHNCKYPWEDEEQFYLRTTGFRYEDFE